MNHQRSIELEKVKGRVLSHIVRNSMLPPREALNDVPNQGMILSLETFLHELYLCVRKELAAYMLGQSMDPNILREERKLIQPPARQIGVVKFDSINDNSISSSAPGGVPAASIHLSGSWLEDCGFKIGQRVGVFLGEKELILRANCLCFNRRDHAAGGVTNG
jgi:hypothetical protein